MFYNEDRVPYTHMVTGRYAFVRVFQKELYNVESFYKCLHDMHSVLNFHNVGKHTEFYLG
jgi:hypothetical protein